jgi:hypothetical protein
MVNRLIGHYVSADGDTTMAGRLWYPNAQATCARIAEEFGLGLPAVTGIVAVLSPSKRWRENVLAAETILRGRRPTNLYTNSATKAERIRDGARALDVVSGPKVSSFFANLLGSRYAVTIDIWAQRAATAKMLEAPKKARYRRLVAAYKSAAAIVGETPRDLQAIVWLATRPAAEHKRDLAVVWGLE